VVCALCLVYVTVGGPFVGTVFPLVVAPLWMRSLALTLGVLCVVSPSWKVLRYGSTLAHELSHLFCAALLGGSVRNIKIRFDASGLATYAAPEEFGKIRHILVASAGYLGPAVVGLSGAWAVVQQRALAWLFCVAAICCVAVLLFLRNVWGILCVSAIAVVLALCVSKATGFIQAGVVSAVSATLLCGGVRDARGQKRVPKGAGTDAEKIASLTMVPAEAVCSLLEITCEMAALCGLALLLFS
jgi:hypothetical protein